MSILSSFLNRVFGIPEQHITVKAIVDEVAEQATLSSIEAITQDWLEKEALVLTEPLRTEIEAKVSAIAPTLSSAIIDQIIVSTQQSLITAATAKIDTLVHWQPGVSIDPSTIIEGSN